MRMFVLAALLLVPSLARAGEPPRGFQLDVTGGVGGAVFDADGAPVVSARAAYGLSVLALGVRGVGVLGPSAIGTFGSLGTKPPNANRAWSILAEVELHSLGTTQFFVSFGAGIGRLIRAQLNAFELYALHGRRAPAYQLSSGVRSFFWPRVALGAEVAGMWWKGIEENQAGPGFGEPVTLTGRTAAGLALSLSLGVRL